jgi:hypothetical protein
LTCVRARSRQIKKPCRGAVSASLTAKTPK